MLWKSGSCESCLIAAVKSITRTIEIYQKNNYGIPSSFSQLICAFGCTDGPTPVEIDDGPADVVVCEGGISGKREGYLRAPTPATRVNLEILEPIFAD